MEQSNGDILCYKVTGTIKNFDTKKPKKFQALKRDTLEAAEYSFNRILTGTLWAITTRGWKVIKRKKKEK